MAPTGLWVHCTIGGNFLRMSRSISPITSHHKNSMTINILAQRSTMRFSSYLVHATAARPSRKITQPHITPTTRSSVTEITGPLGKLPGELRNQIYKLVLIFSEPLLVSGFRQYKPRFGFSNNANGLLFTCKQIRRECADMFFAQNSFLVTIPINIHVAYSAVAAFWRAASTMEGARSIKYLVLMLDSFYQSNQFTAALERLLRGCAKLAQDERMLKHIGQLNCRLEVEWFHHETGALPGSAMMHADVREYGRISKCEFSSFLRRQTSHHQMIAAMEGLHF